MLAVFREAKWPQTNEQVGYSAGGGGGGGLESQPLENFANLNFLKALILLFWCLKTNLKGCDSEN